MSINRGPIANTHGIFCMSHVLAEAYSVSPIDSTAQGSGERRDTLQVHVVWYTRQGPYHTLPDSQKPKPMTWLNGINNSTDMNLNKTQVLVMDRKAWCAVHGVTKSRTGLNG